MNLLSMQFPPGFFYLVTLILRYFQRRILEHPQPYVPPSMWETNFHNRIKQQARLWFCAFYFFWGGGG
jgi:hypothetical protein